MTHLKRLLPIAIAVMLVAGSLSACGGSVVTRPRLERSLAQTFSNEYVKQADLLGHQGVTVSSLHANAFCDKGGPNVPDRGPGADWNCYMHWNDPNVPLSDGTGKFEMNVHSNACYTAGGPSKLTGLLTITDTHGETVDNPVFEFDGCFDPSGSSTPVKSAGRPATVSLPHGQVPIDAGVASPELACSAGAVGGCIGTLTAKVGSKTVASVTYQLPPDGSNSFSFPLAGDDRKLGTKVTLRVNPFLGRTHNATSTVTLGPPPPENG
jgi:hypothetical protein